MTLPSIFIWKVFCGFGIRSLLPSKQTRKIDFRLRCICVTVCALLQKIRFAIFPLRRQKIPNMGISIKTLHTKLLPGNQSIFCPKLKLLESMDSKSWFLQDLSLKMSRWYDAILRSYYTWLLSSYKICTIFGTSSS